MILSVGRNSPFLLEKIFLATNPVSAFNPLTCRLGGDYYADNNDWWFGSVQQIYTPDTEYVNFLCICLFRQSFEEHRVVRNGLYQKQLRQTNCAFANRIFSSFFQENTLQVEDENTRQTFDDHLYIPGEHIFCIHSSKDRGVIKSWPGIVIIQSVSQGLGEQ